MGNEELIEFQKGVGVIPKSIYTLDPRQERFIDSYFNPESKTFGNCYQSALSAGYTPETARNLTHNRPKWLSEKLGQMQSMEPELLLLKLTTIINDAGESTQNKLRAIDMMMKHHHMFGSTQQTDIRFNIESILG